MDIKQIRSLSLIFVLFIGSYHFGFSQTISSGTLKVGAAKSDVTPVQTELPQGYYGIHDKLFCRAIVIEDGTTSAALIGVDQGTVPNDLYDKVTKQIEKELGIPALNIFISASHTHSAPRGGADVERGIIEAVKQAKAK